MSTIIAHPDEMLKEHLYLVWNECKKQGSNKKLSKLFYLMWICHDFWKATKFFQWKIKNENIDLEKQDKIDKYGEHSALGAFLFLYLVLLNFKNLNLSEQETYQFAFAGFYAIAKHHSNLDNLWESFPNLEKKLKILTEQVNNFHIEFIDEFNELIGNIDLNLDFEHFKMFLNQPKKIFWLFSTLLKNKNCEYSLLIKQFYTTLIYADKYKTIFQWKEFLQNKISWNIIDGFREKMGFDKSEDELNKMRNEIYNQINQNIESIDLNEHFFTLNAPTGSWKTYNLLNIWFKLKEKIEKQGKQSKIVYALPFTSIIDQVFDETSKVLKTVWLNPGNFLQKHHYLSWPDENEDYSNSENRFLYTSWEKDIVVTTFYQVFYTVFWNKNKDLIKFKNFENTIFLLDEIQSTPYKYWWLFNQMFQLLAKKYNCYFVLSSATLPNILENAYELLPDYEKYFQKINRTKLDLSYLEKLNLDDFNQILEEKIDLNKNKSFLITLNTIASSVKIYDFVKENFANDFELFYLSTNIIPKHRKQRIKAIKNTNVPKIVVSTQLIEAGVDIDLDIWFRDFWPLDSVIQVLWRLNRNGKKEQASLYLVNLVNEKNKTYDRIYDFLNKNITWKLLETKKIIEEKNYLKLFKEYFKLLNENKEKDSENKLWRYFCEWKFKNLWKEFKLIEQTFETVDIFVKIDEQAGKIWEKFESILKIKDRWERKEKFDKLKPYFLEYIISVNKDKVKNCGFNTKELERGLVCLKDEFLTEYYDKYIGFRILDKDQAILNDNFI